MARDKSDGSSFEKINRIKPGTNLLFSVVMSVLAVLTVLPVLLVFIISITSSDSLAHRSFSFFPESTSFIAYQGLFKTGSRLLDSYIITVEVTALHTVLSVLIRARAAALRRAQILYLRRIFHHAVLGRSGTELHNKRKRTAYV